MSSDKKPKKKLKNPTTLFAAIEKSQHNALRLLAFKERRSIAEITREALDLYFKKKGGKK